MFISAIFASFLFLHPNTFAQTPDVTPNVTAAKATGLYSKVCLPATRATSEEMANLPKKDHVVNLTKSNLPKDRDIYIVGCIITNDGGYCQTGSAANDAAVEKLNFPIKPYPGHSFQVFGNNPIRTTDGNLQAYVYSHTPGQESHTFYAVFAADLNVTSGQGNTLQYGTFELLQDPGQCVGIHWDPSGRAFDAQSLEPLPNVEVTLLNNQKHAVAPNLVDPNNPANASICQNSPLRCLENNPQLTLQNGEYNFDVLDGTYYLNMLKTGYVFPVNLGDVNPKYTIAYGCDEGSKTYTLYTRAATNVQHPIRVNGALVHCDAPLISSTGEPYHAEPVVMTDRNGNLEYGHTLLPGTTIVKYEGVVSHPFTKVALVDSVTGQVVVEGSADKFGNWSLTLDNEKLSSGGASVLNLQLTKVDLTLGNVTSKRWNLWSALLNLFKVKTVSAQNLVSSSGVSFEPIFTYIEGYAYDKAGKVLPGATIDIKVNNYADSLYETTADANGFFTIAPDNLPIFSYYLEITPAGSTTKIKYTTSQFAKVNKDYLTSNNINLMTAKKNNQSLLPISAVKPTSNVAQVSPGVGTAQGNANVMQNQYLVLFAVVVIIFLLGVTGGVLLYIKKKEAQSTGQTNQQM